MLEGHFECRAVRPASDIALDFSAGGGRVRVEVLGASRLFDPADSPKIGLKGLTPRIVPV